MGFLSVDIRNGNPQRIQKTISNQNIFQSIQINRLLFEQQTHSIVVFVAAKLKRQGAKMLRAEYPSGNALIFRVKCLGNGFGRQRITVREDLDRQLVVEFKVQAGFSATKLLQPI